MSRKGRGSRRRKGQRPPVRPGTSVTAGGPAEAEDNAIVRLAEGIEQRFSETDVPLATDYSDRQLWRTVMRRVNENQVEAAAIMKEVRLLVGREEPREPRGKSEHDAAVARAIEAAIRDRDENRAAAIKDAEERREVEVRIVETGANREEDRKDREEERKDREEGRKDARARNESWQEILLMAMTAITFLCTIVLVFIGVIGGEPAALGASTFSALFSVGGIRSLFVAHRSRAED